MAPTKHATYSASSSSQWLTCPGSKVLTQQYEAIVGRPLVYPSTGAAAQIGTNVHALFEKSLKGEKLDDSEKQLLEENDFIDSYTEAVKLVRAKIKKDGLSLYLEQRLAHPTLPKLLFGTSDVVAFNETEFHIYDLKTGKGQIDANSSQLLVYLSLAVAKFGTTQKRFVAHILQIDGNELKHREYSYKRESIDVFLNHTLVEGVRRIEDAPQFNDFLYPSEYFEKLIDKGYFCPHSNCRWCVVKNECPLQTQLQELQSQLAFADFPSRKESLLKRTVDISKFADELKEEAKTRLLNGEDIEGLELKETTRTALVEEVVREILGQQGFKESLKTQGELKKQKLLEQLPPGAFSESKSYSVKKSKNENEEGSSETI